MNFLLLLSALLSALTGASVGLRRAEPAQAVAQQVHDVATVAPRPVPTVRPTLGLPTLAMVARASSVMRLPVTRSPLFADRRRE